VEVPQRWEVELSLWEEVQDQEEEVEVQDRVVALDQDQVVDLDQDQVVDQDLDLHQ
jgi:hypothetical protein